MAIKNALFILQSKDFKEKEHLAQKVAKCLKISSARGTI
jgi:hypothetical protein